VDVDIAALHAHGVSFPGDHPLDEHLLRIERVVEHHDVAGARIAELVHHLVYDEPIAIVDRRRHAEPFDADDLDAERADEDDAADDRYEQLNLPGDVGSETQRAHRL